MMGRKDVVLVEDGTEERLVSKRATEGVVVAVTVWHGAEDLSSCQLTDAIVDKSRLDETQYGSAVDGMESRRRIRKSLAGG